MSDVRTLAWAVFVAAAYAAWSIVGKYLGFTGQWLATTVIAGTALSMISLSIGGLRAQGPPAIPAIIVLFIVGAINGAAMFVHSWKAADPSIQTGLFSMTIYVLMIIAAPLFDRLLNGTQLSKQQLAAVCLAIAVAYLAQS